MKIQITSHNTKNIIRLGKLLNKKKIECTTYAEWTTWIKENLEFDLITAEFYIECYEKREELRLGAQFVNQYGMEMTKQFITQHDSINHN